MYSAIALYRTCRTPSRCDKTDMECSARFDSCAVTPHVLRLCPFYVHRCVAACAGVQQTGSASKVLFETVSSQCHAPPTGSLCRCS
jgi:hypothetical protein